MCKREEGEIQSTQKEIWIAYKIFCLKTWGENPQRIGRNYKEGMKTCTWFNLVLDLIQSLTSVSPVKILLFQQKVQNIITTLSIRFLQTLIQLLSKVTKSSVLYVYNFYLNRFFYATVIEYLKWRGHLEHLSLDERIILKGVLKIGWERVD